jgi:hypothetical protein
VRGYIHINSELRYNLILGVMITYIIARPTKSEKATPIRQDVTFSEFRLTVATTMRLPSKDLEMCYRLSTWPIKKRTSLDAENDYQRMVKEYLQAVEQRLKRKKTQSQKSTKPRKATKGKSKVDEDEESAGITIYIYDERDPAELKVFNISI